MGKHSTRSSTSSRKLVRVIVSIIVIISLLALGYGAFLYLKINNTLDNIAREDLLPTHSGYEQAPPVDVNANKPITYLLLGSDSRGEGDTGRSDTLMLAYIPSNRENVYLLSMPRDIYVPIPGHSPNKINEAYSRGGAPLTVQTVEELLDTRIDHVAIIDFRGFMNLIDSLGGVTINNPYEGCDTSQGGCWEKGKITLDKEQALKYVRWRYGLPNGDITRTENQQRVVKAIFSKTLAEGSLTNLNEMTELLNQVTSNITVDSTLTNDEIKATMLNMKVRSANDIRELTIPIQGYSQDPVLGSLDIIDEERMLKLKNSIANDDLESYWLEHKDDPVAGDATVTIKE